MPKVMRLARGATICAVVVAALALGACANNKDLAGQGLAGSAVPGSQQDFVVNVGDRVFFESDSTELTHAIARDARQAGAVAADLQSQHLHRRGPRRRAWHARIQHRARARTAPRPCATISHRAASIRRACARFPTARSVRSRSATTSRVGRRIAAPSRCSAQAHKFRCGGGGDRRPWAPVVFLRHVIRTMNPRDESAVPLQGAQSQFRRSFG